MIMKTETTERGFRIIRFADSSGTECTLQKSSLATDDAVWFGVQDANPQMFVPYGDPAWRPMPLPAVPHGGHISFTTRMHLTREQVADLLPTLKHFVDTGELPDG